MKKDKENLGEAPQTKEQTDLALSVQTKFRGAYNAKVQIDLPNKWAKFDDYIRNIQNEPLTEDHPGSVTNIIKPIIDSQISDLVNHPYTVNAKGREPSDHMYSTDIQHLMEFVLDNNKFVAKLTQSERDRLELGTTVVKVYMDTEALDGKGLPTFEIISPANFFPDPKWTSSRLLQECEFVIHAVPRPLSWIRRKFKKLGKYVQRQVCVPYDPDLQTENFKTEEVEVDTSQKALVIECYLKDENGEIYCLIVANDILLEDSREVLKGKKLQRRNLYPFEVIPCYTMRGTGWGQGDAEILIPTQDMINDMDDQIRMTARMMGNPQIAIGMNAGKGFDHRKWTNAPGLKVPLRDVNSFKVIPPAPVSGDVVNRREKGFQEADIISGRPDVSRGETPGNGVTAASAISMLQQAGQKIVLHKAKTWKEGWKGVLGLLYDEVMTNWDEPMWVRINGTVPDYKFIDPMQLRNAQVMVPNLNPMEGEDSIKPLMGDPEPMMDGEMPMLDELGQPMMQAPQPMTRECEFDLELSMGDGLPTDLSFAYQMALELSSRVVEGRPLMSWKEMRDFLRDRLGIELGSDEAIQLPLPAGAMPMLGDGANVPIA